MFIGHLAVGFAGKKIAPEVSLGASFMAAMFADFLWPVFILLGWEEVRILPGATKVMPLDFVSYPYSHSLLALAGWGILVGAVYFAATGCRRGAAWMGISVLSHWFLDAAVHRPDLALYPGGALKLGLGLWNSVPGTFLVEGAMFAAGLRLYVSATRSRGKAGAVSLWSFTAVILVLYAASLMGMTPPSARDVAYGDFAAWLFPLWGLWIDRSRELQAAS